MDNLGGSNQQSRHVGVQAGWKVQTSLVEVGCRGFTGASIQKLLKALGIIGAMLRKTLKEQKRQSKGASGSGSEGKTRHGESKDPRSICRGRQRDVPVTAPPPRDVPGLIE